MPIDNVKRVKIVVGVKDTLILGGTKFATVETPGAIEGVALDLRGETRRVERTDIPSMELFKSRVTQVPVSGDLKAFFQKPDSELKWRNYFHYIVRIRHYGYDTDLTKSTITGIIAGDKRIQLCLQPGPVTSIKTDKGATLELRTTNIKAAEGVKWWELQGSINSHDRKKVDSLIIKMNDADSKVKRLRDRDRLLRNV
ncbi:MAG TPA: hypothetical protein VMV00_00945 [Candidatus Baltobacteraceae bacterium]|nr:hypothetical protein [Candidatus Baltobacteraceae bacterium]